MPVHTIGWGKSHDPSSLWLLSNHTGGTYTFVKDFYDLRDAVAGIIGGVLSIAATSVKLHISVPENRLFRIRKVSGTPNAVVSSQGRDVDVEIGELRFGEKKEMLIEVEMALSNRNAGAGDHFLKPDEGGAGAFDETRSFKQHKAYATATDEFFLNNVGLDPATLDDYQSSSFYDDEYDGMPEELPLFEVNCAYRDPVLARNVARLGHTPTLLAITVCPPTAPGARQPTLVSDPSIVRRRMELFVS